MCIKNHKIFVSLLFILMAVCYGCKNEERPIVDPENPQNEYKVFTIKEGDHYSDNAGIAILNKDSLDFQVIFDSSAVYKNVIPENQHDINKLIGFSDCNTGHLENSIRIGWRFSDDSLRLFAFAHNDGKMIEKEISTVEIGRVVTGKIKVVNSEYYCTINNKSDSLPRFCTGTVNSRYMLYPYFGGDEAAPQKITIKLKYD